MNQADNRSYICSLPQNFKNYIKRQVIHPILVLFFKTDI